MILSSRSMNLLFLLGTAALSSQFATSFFIGTQPSSSASLLTKKPSTSLHMISNLMGGSKKDSEQNVDLPRDVKDAVSSCRQSVQKALESRKSRMIVEMPVGAKFGVEKASKTGGKKKSALSSMQNDDAAGGPTQEMLDTSDRELARLFVEMFQPVGGDNIAVVFNEGELADLAGKKWKGDASATCKIMSLNRRSKVGSGGGGSGGGRGMGGKGKKKKKNMGFAAKLAAEVDDDSSSGSGGGGGGSGPFKLPDKCEVALFVSPGPREYIIIERICNEVGMGTLVVLLNSRLDKMEKFASADAEQLFTEEFENIFHLAASPYQNVSPNCLVYHAYPNDWILARKPKVGAPKTIARQKEKFNEEDCRLAYESVEIGDMEKGVEDVLENVANWFK